MRKLDNIKKTMSPKAQIQHYSMLVSIWFRSNGFFLFDEEEDEEVEGGGLINSGMIGVIIPTRDEEGDRYYVGYLSILLSTPWIFYLYGPFVGKANELVEDLQKEFDVSVRLKIEDLEYETVDDPSDDEEDDSLDSWEDVRRGYHQHPQQLGGAYLHTSGKPESFNWSSLILWVFVLGITAYLWFF